MIVGNKTFDKGTYVMAIINLTPDSFWERSRCTKDEILFRTDKAVKDGAAIIDVGAQSTRPGYVEISAEEEISRFEEPIRLIKENFDIPLSVDTYFSKSAKAALSLGADMINDIWGLTHDEDMAKTIAKAGAAVCIMHNAKQQLEGDIWNPIRSFLINSVKTALQAGIDRQKICLDGGVGFAKDRTQNIELATNYSSLKDLGYPLLLGVSRKSLFGGKVEERLDKTIAMSEMAAREGIMFVRVHDVAENFAAVQKVLKAKI